MVIRAYRGVLLAASLVLMAMVSFAQEADSVQQPEAGGNAQTKTVEVSRAFAPSIGDADRIHYLPSIDDTLRAPMAFEYTLSPRPMLQGYAMRELPPARMSKEPLRPISPFFIKLGYGNYTSPLAQVYISGGRRERLGYAISLDHNSSFGEVTLASGESVKAPESLTGVGVHATGVFKTFAVRGQATYAHDYSAFYGRKDTLHQAYNTLWGSTTSAHRYGIALDAYSTYLDSSHFNYAGRFAIDRYSDDRQMSQTHVHASVKGHVYMHSECFGGEIRLNHYGKDMNSQEAPNTQFSLAPWAKLFGDRWRVIVGCEALLDANRGTTGIFLYPRAHFSYDIVRHYLIPYVEADGGVETADYSTLRRENPWAAPGQLAWNASRKMQVRGGVKGNFTPRATFDFFVAYALVDSMHFWVNNRLTVPVTLLTRDTIYGSDFGLVYDNVERVHARGEIAYGVSERFDCGVEVDYWHYKLRKVSHAWHRPSYRAVMRIDYNLRRKVFAGLYLYLEGGQVARGLNGDPIDLGVNYDLNLNVRYRFTKSFSAFAEVRNLLAARHDTYYLYPQRRFQGYLGIVMHF